MNGRRLSPCLLVGVAIFVVFGHICAAPFHAHAGAVTTHSEDHPASGSDDAAHGGSCEALRAQSDVDAPVLLPTGIVLPVVGDLETLRARPTSAAGADEFPPALPAARCATDLSLPLTTRFASWPLRGTRPCVSRRPS